jgi:predicted TPR repeat methyltransferase
VFGAGLKLAAHGAGSAVDGTAVSYVEALFDQYAPQFEQSLVERLGYRVPQMLDALVSQEMARLGIDGFARALDLGCGTGLMGQQLRAKVAFLEGVDVSAAMIAEAARRASYDRLEKAELVAFLAGRAPSADLVTAADVFIYCGALPPVLAAVVPAMMPGGLLAFSLEAHEGDEPVFLRASLRYAHGVARGAALRISHPAAGSWNAHRGHAGGGPQTRSGRARYDGRGLLTRADTTMAHGLFNSGGGAAEERIR